jgi:undecaprenyl-diphosphatase
MATGERYPTHIDDAQPAPHEVARKAAREVGSGRLTRSGRRALGVLAALLFAGFLADSYLVATVHLLPFDLPVERFIQRVPWGPQTQVMELINWLAGYLQIVLGVLVVVGLALLDRRAGWLMTIGSVASVMDNFVKLLFERHRPTTALVHVLDQASGYSYPSGHAVFFTWLAFMLAFWLAPMVRPRLRPLLWVGAAYLVVTVCLARVWAGAHWPSDVLGGFLLAMAWSSFVLWLPERWLPQPSVRWLRWAWSR